jgi:hypothetical protein
MAMPFRPGGRHYPPAPVIFHEVTCPAAPRGVISMPIREAYTRNPHSAAHRCINPKTVASNRVIVVAEAVYPSHGYERSTILPDDAVRELCRVCQGTHPEEMGEGAGFLPPPTWTGRS